MKETLFRGLILIALLYGGIDSAKGEWEQILENPNTYAHYITESGIQLSSDYQDDMKGGILYSEDGGLTWQDSGVKDYWYNKFYEGGGYVFASGSACRIARSSDEGRTWEVLNYSKVVEPYLASVDLDMTACYAITSLDDVLYAGDFTCGVVMKSENWGESWTALDTESLKINFGGDLILDNVYNLAPYNGYIYCFGLYSVHRMLPEEGIWHEVPVESNCMSCSINYAGYLVCGRAMPNDSYNSDFLLYTDGENWKGITRPDTFDNNVRALYTDGQTIYAMNSGGPLWYTSDFGGSWNCSDSLPDYMYPLTISADDNYVYTALYSPIPEDMLSGVWRISKSELGIAGIASIPVNERFIIKVTNDSLVLSTWAESITIFDAAGKRLTETTGCNKIMTDFLPKGEYLYVVCKEGKRVSGKFKKL